VVPPVFVLPTVVPPLAPPLPPTAASWPEDVLPPLPVAVSAPGACASAFCRPISTSLLPQPAGNPAMSPLKKIPKIAVVLVIVGLPN
jgi:hypothetical protein